MSITSRTSSLSTHLDPDEVVYYNSSDFIVTETGNKVSKSAKLHAVQNIIVGGKTIIKPDVIIRADLLKKGQAGICVAIGKYSCLEEGCEIKPPQKIVNNFSTHFPITIGDYVTIGKNSLVEATSIANNVVIGEGAKVGGFCTLKEGCIILPNSQVAPNTVIAPWTVYGGVPAKFYDEVPPTSDIQNYRTTYYNHFVGK